MKPRICLDIADHRDDDHLTDLVGSLRALESGGDIAVYNSGDAQRLRRHTVYGSVTVLPASRQHT